MKAARIHGFGGPDVVTLEDVTVLWPRPEEILVRVIASGVNSIEFQVREGHMQETFSASLPLTLGWACAGVVAAVGAQVRRFEIGDAVFAYPGLARGGTHAEAVTLPANCAALRPRNMTFEQAAAAPMTAQTAWAIMSAAGIRPAEQVLIHGADSAIGHWLVQLVHRAGAYVIATASRADLSRVRALGADELRCSSAAVVQAWRGWTNGRKRAA
jgi:NADPH:quinone reductase-like Zn-dependent oxidoreductase